MKVEYVDHLGDDLRVVNAARVSFDKESDWEYPVETKTVEGGPFGDQDYHYISGPNLSEKDQKLISYLAKHNHFTPFTHVMITMRETVPIFVARQRFKHMVGFTYNEVSRRYVDDEPEFYTPEVWRKRADNKKQGSSDEEWKDELGFDIEERLQYVMTDLKDLYTDMINSGIAPEQARMVLPQSMYTSYYVTGSLSAWARAYKLRIDPHAQKEIQDLANMWNDTISNIKELEYSWKALTE